MGSRPITVPVFTQAKKHPRPPKNTCTHTQTHIHTHARVHTHTHTNTHPYTCARAHTHTHTPTPIHTPSHTHTHTTQTHTRANTHTPTHTHTQTRTHIHTQTSTIPMGFKPAIPVFEGFKTVKPRTVRPTWSEFAAYVSVNNKAEVVLRLPLLRRKWLWNILHIRNMQCVNEHFNIISASRVFERRTSNRVLWYI
jgi:hypothetical protein